MRLLTRLLLCTPLWLAGTAASAAPVPCAMNCEIGSREFSISFTCENGAASDTVRDESRFDYGPSGERNVTLTLDRQRTYSDSGRTYHIEGWIRVDRTAGQVSYDLKATGGPPGSAPFSCEARPVAPAASKEKPPLPAKTEAAPPPTGSPRTAPDAALRVPEGYQSSITVPECERARAEAKLPGETWACFASEKGEYVGQGKLWLLPGGTKPMKVSYTAFGRLDGRVDVTMADGAGAWAASFSPPRGAEWQAGRYATMRDAFQDQQHAGLSVSAHSSACGEETGVLELLELTYDARSRTVTRLAADLEQVCGGKRLRGLIRFAAP